MFFRIRNLSDGILLRLQRLRSSVYVFHFDGMPHVSCLADLGCGVSQGIHHNGMESWPLFAITIVSKCSWNAHPQAALSAQNGDPPSERLDVSKLGSTAARDYMAMQRPRAESQLTVYLRSYCAPQAIAHMVHLPIPYLNSFALAYTLSRVLYNIVYYNQIGFMTDSARTRKFVGMI